MNNTAIESRIQKTRNFSPRKVLTNAQLFKKLFSFLEDMDINYDMCLLYRALEITILHRI